MCSILTTHSHEHMHGTYMQGIPKPIHRAFELLRTSGTRRIATDEVDPYVACKRAQLLTSPPIQFHISYLSILSRVKQR